MSRKWNEENRGATEWLHMMTTRMSIEENELTTTWRHHKHRVRQVERLTNQWLSLYPNHCSSVTGNISIIGQGCVHGIISYPCRNWFFGRCYAHHLRDSSPLAGIVRGHEWDDVWWRSLFGQVFRRTRPQEKRWPVLIEMNWVPGASNDFGKTTFMSQGCHEMEQGGKKWWRICYVNSYIFSLGGAWDRVLIPDQIKVMSLNNAARFKAELAHFAEVSVRSLLCTQSVFPWWICLLLKENSISLAKLMTSKPLVLWNSEQSIAICVLKAITWRS